MQVMFVLVALWTGAYKGSEVVITGFTTLEQCQLEGARLKSSSRLYETFHCVEVK